MVTWGRNVDFSCVSHQKRKKQYKHCLYCFFMCFLGFLGHAGASVVVSNECCFLGLFGRFWGLEDFFLGGFG